MIDGCGDRLMSQHYSRQGIHFHYPDGWTIEENHSDEGYSASISPDEDDPIGAGFWSINRIPIEDDLTAQEVADEVLQAFVDEYDDIDVYPAVEPIAHRHAIGYDVDFVCLELTNTAHIRVLPMGSELLLLLTQFTDYESEELQSLLQEVTNSLSCSLDAGMAET
ncbi:MAG: hypothetical protein R3C01_07015 [Planctomycetaceae bacterium]